MTSIASSPESIPTALSPESSLDSVPTTETQTLTTESSVVLSPDESPEPEPPIRIRMAPKPLPGRTARGAPEFDGKALSIKRYWEDIEEIAESHERTTDAEKIKIAMRYIEREDELLWKGHLDPNAPPTWAAFKAKIEDLYPGADGDRLFTAQDLETFITDRSIRKIKTRDDLSEYYRKFKTITAQLTKEGKMSAMEAQKEFPRGLDDGFRGRVFRRLEIVKPNHPSGKPYELEDLVKAGHYVLESPGTITDTEGAVSIKKEMVDLSDAFAKMNERYHVDMQSLTQAITRTAPRPSAPSYPMYQVTAAEPQPAYQPPPPQPQQYRPEYSGGYNSNGNRGGYQQRYDYAPRQPWNDGPSNRGAGFPAGECGFCSAHDHFLRECPVAGDFMRDGKCFRNGDNKIVLPNGQFVPRAITGRNLAERIERWLNQNPARQPQRQQQPQHPPEPAPAARIETFEREQPPHIANAMTYASSVPVQTMAFGEVPNPLAQTEEEAAVWANERTRPKKPVPEVVIQKKAPAKSSLKPTIEIQPAAKPVEAKTQPPLPAFKYQAACENPEMVKEVIERAQKNKILVSHEELCALSAEFRRHYRDATVTKRIPTVESSFYGETPALVMRYTHMEEPRTTLLTASPIDSLRVLDITVNEHRPITCTLDTGSEIVAMNRSVWQELGVHLSPEKTLVMESADSNQSTTAGLVENLKFSLGGIDLLLQAHVVDGAPFDILLGRPFFRFTECQTKDHIDGTQDLTLTCPNTGRVVTVASRRKEPKHGTFVEADNFSIVETLDVDFA